MATNHTEHYNLSQWVRTDPVLMFDFNEDNAKIDAALHRKAEIICGTYTGDGTESRLIDLGRPVKGVFLCTQDGRTTWTDGGGSITMAGGLAVTGTPLFQMQSGGGFTGMEIEGNGFRVYFKSGSGYSVMTNGSGRVYIYVAFL